MFGKKLRFLRNQRNLTQLKMAELLGVTRQAYGNYENQVREPDLETVRSLADIFRVPINYLIGDDKLNGNPSVKLLEIAFALGDDYHIKVIDVENVIYRDLKNGYDFEISGLDNNRNDFKASLFIWKYEQLGNKKVAYRIVETIGNIKTFEELRRVLDNAYKKYSGDLIVSNEPETIAAHHDGDWTDEELEEIEQFKEFVRLKRKME